MATKQPVILDGATHNVIQSTDKIDSTTINTNPSAANMLINDATTGLIVQLNTENNNVGLSGNGTAALPLKAVINLQTGVGNLASTNDTGLMVKLNTASGNGVTVSGTGVSASPLKVEAEADPVVGNRLTVSAAGLLTPTRSVADTSGTNYLATHSTQTIKPVFDPTKTGEVYMYFFSGVSNILVIDFTDMPSKSNFDPLYKIRISIKSDGFVGNMLKFAGVPKVTSPDGSDQDVSTYFLPFPANNYYDTYDIYPCDSRANYPYIVKVRGTNDVPPNVKAGDIGSYAFMRHSDTATQHSVAFGVYVAGPDYRFAGTTVSMDTPIPQGTWECCGGIANAGEATMFRRIT